MKPLPVIQPAGPQEPATQSQSQIAPMTHDPSRARDLQPQIVAALRTVFDPELPVNVYDLGLIYDIIIDASGAVGIRMTLTAPACPAAQFLPGEVKRKVGEISGVTDVVVDIVWEPPWDRSRMSEAAKLQLGLL
jgi:FeS assembly SUF system protein